jgi:hypothetical protein
MSQLTLKKCLGSDMSKVSDIVEIEHALMDDWKKMAR